MKRILLLFFLTSTLFANAQVFQESFNTGIPSTWTISNNGVGLGQSWMNSPASLGNNATVAAMVANETGTAANPVQDWLITPQVNLTGVPNPQLVFVGKTTPVGPNRNSVLKIMISTTGTAPGNFTLLHTYTESFSGAVNPISPNANFGLKTLNLTGYANQNVYIAFVMENIGVGKSWLIDDVKFFNQCLDVTNIMISDVDLDSGVISWVNPGGAASFEIEVVTGNNQPTGVATHTSTVNSIEIPLVFGVNYKVYVRAVCSGNTSGWVVSNQFTPKTPGSDCYSALNINSLPYSHSDTTANYGDDYSGSAGNSCGAAGNYLNGDDVVYAFTPNENMDVEVELIPQDVYSSIFVYDSCANIGVSCIAGVANANANIRQINNLSLTAGTTYYFVISTRPTPQSVQYTFNIQRIRCVEPINLTATNFTQSSAQLGWQNGVGNNATSWQIFVQNTADNLPVTSGTTVTSLTPVVNQLQNGTPLQPSTIYEYYVRASCGDGNFSTWAGPYTFNTLCAPFNLPYSEGFNTTSPSEICWNVINNNNDARLWDMNFTQTPFEGNQSASINAVGSGTATNDDYLVSPVFNFNGQYRLRYKYRTGTTTAQNFSVKMSQNGGIGVSDFSTVLVPDTGYNNITYKEKIVYLPNFIGTGAISWHVQSNMASRVFIDDVIIEAVPSCPEPYDVVNTSSTATNMVLDWQQFGTVASWDVVLVPAGTPFTGNTTGLTVYNTTTKPFTTPVLPSGTLYDVYVRSNCSGTNQSTWSIAGSGFTKAPNDECINAIPIPVNPDTECVSSVDGSLIGATNSNLGTVCTGVSNNDVWFQFTATQATHILKISEIVGNVTTLYTVLYSGDCAGGLTQIECDNFTNFNEINTYNNLVAGTTYYIKIYSLTAPAITTYNVCILSPLPPIRTSNNEYTVPELVTEILINNPCAEVTNVTWRTSSNSTGPLGIGYFEKNGSSFAYNDGIILSSGFISAAPGPKLAGNQSNGSSAGDASLNALLLAQGVTGTTNNASVLEFDFTAITDQMSFNFLFASDEYGQFQCGYSDIFAFLLTDLTTGITTNIAVIPNTTIPVAVTTIRDQQYNTTCGSANIQYFDRYFEGGNDAASLGAPINFFGQTVSMIAQSAVVPGNTYHIKLAIADYSDGSFDSAVFIEGGSFQLGTIELGTDLTVEENNALCATQSYTLDSGVDMDQYTVQWLKDGEPIPGATNPVLIVTESGTYTIEATYIGSSCAVSDSIVVEIYPLFIDDFQEPELIKVCHNDVKIVDLTVNEAVMLNGIPATDFTFEYFSSISDLNDNVNAITNPQAFFVDRSYKIYVKIKNLISGCEEVMSFDIEYIIVDEPMLIEDVVVCTSYQLPELPDGQKYFTGPGATGENLKENSYIAIGKHEIYIYSQKDKCFEETTFNVEVLNCSIPKGISPNGDGLNDNFDLSFFNILKLQIFNRHGKEVYSHGPGYTNQWIGQSNSGGMLPSATYFYTVITPFETLTGWVQLVQEQN